MSFASLPVVPIHQSHQLYLEFNQTSKVSSTFNSLTDQSQSLIKISYLDGLPAIITLLAWFVGLVVPYLVASYFKLWYSKPHSHKLNQSGSPQDDLLLPSLQHFGTSSVITGSHAVWEAENRIIEATVQKDGGLGVVEYLKFDYESSENPICIQPWVGIARAWKDWVTTIGTLALVGVSVLRYRDTTQLSHSGTINWLLLPVLVWAASSVLSIFKLRLSIQAHAQNREHVGDIYAKIEKGLIPIYLLFLPFTFYDTWNALLFQFDQSSSPLLYRLVALRESTFIILTIITLIELCTPRPTKLLPPRKSISKASQQTLPDTIPPPLEPRSSLLSLAYYAHSDKYLWQHAFKTATKASIPDLRADDKTASVLFRWKYDQAEYTKMGIKPSLLRSLGWHFRSEILTQQFFAWFDAVGALLPPFFLQRLLGFISDKASGDSNQKPNHVPILYAIGMLATQLFLAYTQSASLFTGRRLSVRLRALFISLIFTKSLRRTDIKSKPTNDTGTLSQDDDKKNGVDEKGEELEARASIGKIVNLVSNDTMSLSEIGAYLSFLWPESIVQLALAVIYLYYLLGYSAMAGVICMVIGIPIQSLLTNLWAKFQKQLMKASDRRLGLTGELINNIRVVKFFAWESKFMEKMTELRDLELCILFKRIIVGLSQTAVSFSVPIAVSVVTFYVHTEVRNEPLTAEQAFTALALFNVLRFPLAVMAGLLSDTIRNNILFGSIMNSTRYEEVLKACALVPDLLTFTDGDLTEIGDKGTVLSGGQKARISLARALYSPAKFLLLDDILSAVDSHTGQHLFENVLTGNLMKDRTCILVTHAVDLCLPGAGYVVSLDQGEVIYAGKPTLSKTNSLIFDQGAEDSTKAKLESVSHQEQTIEELAEPSDPQLSVIATKATQKLVEDEEQAVGAVSWTVYKLYFKALGGFFPIAITLILYAGSEFGNAISNWILKEWAGANDTKAKSLESNWMVMKFIYNPIITVTTLSREVPELLYWHRSHENIGTLDSHAQVDKYIQWYTLASVITLFLQLLRQFYFTMRSVKAARKIYDCLIRTVLNAKVRFFDTVPTGRILNRFTKDVQTMDRDLADNLIYLTNDIIAAIAILCVVVVVLPIGFLVVCLGASLFYAVIGYIYLASTREIKRSESTARSPVISTCTECLQGATSIRAYGDIGRWTELAFRHIDQYNRSYFMLWVCNRWLSSRIDVAAAFFAFAVTVWMIQNDVSAALAGFALSYVISFNIKTLWVVRWWSINEINMNSLERIHEYLDIDQEPKSGVLPPAAWPSRNGSIEVENLSVCYAKNLPRVLKGVSFRVEPGEKIGICGRTGSGKSTLALSFFRFIEAEEGRIVIDGQDISKLDLATLRSRLTIIPQESVMFTATIRWNLDPFSEHEDSRIWDALRRVGMAAPLGIVNETTARSGTSGSGENEIAWITSLDLEVEDGGRNFSTGQRQLLAIARAILKLQNNSILILDESTASLDAESDEKIQKTIRTEMENATILCIAHRLKTIVDYDKVLVLGQGEVLEFGKPAELLSKEGSAFKQLCERSGNLEELKKMAGC
ncbi:hypothetical protein CROQUDRAFT_664859 [Cronartium quercuum f. sp. fusiforme G11]|uniref:Uncharacterized protein n=1 Tax=Cronartium quercuum f. sp. fusiforme G11 TaxID=708437 RepID=A0A9P6N6V7_9BASI|nr:hypothetical protein CROQUDRAFT_664859 [Cronartium quercuum f. sp. fusiforme G11]